MAVDKTYRHDLDLLKGLAIVAVILYHAGWCKSGYLGVDVFFVLSGYFIVPKVIKGIETGSFRYFSFLEKRIFRLLPLVLLVSGLSLAVGYWGMLPLDLRYLSEEVIASSFFANNILQSLTTQNYWAAIYHKVLMHNWYLGVLFQFYLIFPLLMLLFRRRMKVALIVLTLISMLLYLLPIDTIGNKYYMIQYRFFEIAVGGLMAMRTPKSSTMISYASFTFMILMILFGAFTIGERAMPYNLVGGTNTIRESFLPREVILLLTVSFTLLYIYTSSSESRLSRLSGRSKLMAPLGRMSLSLFLWHQPLFAFYRNFFADEIAWAVLVAIIILTLFLSIITYTFLEKRIRITKTTRFCLLATFLIVNAFAFRIYQQGGIVRDIPELDLRIGDDPTAFELYTDRIYKYDRDFDCSDTIRKKVLVVGNSFARDFANILLESKDSCRIQLSYRYTFEDCPLNRIYQCDRIFFFGWKHQVPDVVWKNMNPKADIWGIGTKNHGTSNGIFYKNRHCPDYFTQRVKLSDDYIKLNNLLREEWQGKYVDLLSFTMQSDNMVQIFTPNHQFITYDGRHLTLAGTRYYSCILLFGW